MNNFPQESSSGGMEKGVDHIKSVDGFSIEVHQDATLGFDECCAVPMCRDEELAPILDSIGDLLKKKGEEVASIFIVSKGSVKIRATVYEDGVPKYYVAAAPKE